MIKEYWQRSVYLPFIDFYYLFIIEHDENKINEPNQCPAEKWDHVMLLPDIFMEN